MKKPREGGAKTSRSARETVWYSYLLGAPLMLSGRC